MRLLFTVPVLLLVMGVELFALVRTIQKFRSPWLALVLVILLFVVNAALFVLAGRFLPAAGTAG